MPKAAFVSPPKSGKKRAVHRSGSSGGGSRGAKWRNHMMNVYAQGKRKFGARYSLGDAMRDAKKCYKN
jgi:hypothetical protein